MVGQAKRFAKEIAEGVKRASDLIGQLALDALRQHIDEMVPRVRQVMKQTRARIYRGDTRAEGKIVSLFEPATEVIRKRISVAKRRHGLNRCRYRGDVGLKRWVGLGVLADNLINASARSSIRSPQDYHFCLVIALIRAISSGDDA